MFAQQECVSLVVAKRVEGGYEVLGPEVGRALVNYTSAEITRVKGQYSSKIRDMLGYAGEFARWFLECGGAAADAMQIRSILRTGIIRRFLSRINIWRGRFGVGLWITGAV